jgi:hypothetical protein
MVCDAMKAIASTSISRIVLVVAARRSNLCSISCAYVVFAVMLRNGCKGAYSLGLLILDTT